MPPQSCQPGVPSMACSVHICTNRAGAILRWWSYTAMRAKHGLQCTHLHQPCWSYTAMVELYCDACQAWLAVYTSAPALLELYCDGGAILRCVPSMACSVHICTSLAGAILRWWSYTAMRAKDGLQCTHLHQLERYCDTSKSIHSRLSESFERLNLQPCI